MQQHKHISISAVVAVLSLMIFSSSVVNAQCRVFVRNTCVPELRPYIHDGSYQAVMMGEGEEAEVYKTIFAGQQYRLFVCVDNTLPNVEFVVSDTRRNILFDNRRNNNVNFWNFKPESSQQIKVTIRVPRSQRQGEMAHGCVGVLFGLLDQ